MPVCLRMTKRRQLGLVFLNWKIATRQLDYRAYRATKNEKRYSFYHYCEEDISNSAILFDLMSVMDGQQSPLKLYIHNAIMLCLCR
jgi:hypothetical protein